MKSQQVQTKGFPRTFWVANGMELFERAAYYGLNALLGRYLTDKVGGGLGFETDDVGLLQGVVYALTYTLPILGGALADRYGYKRMMLIAFSFLSAGYFLSGIVTTYSVLFATLLLVAVGSGLFKPVISGTIARSTNETNSGLGFGIFYWMINLGAVAGPLIAGYLKGFQWSYVFVASSLYCAAMMIPAALLYKDPPRPENTKNIKEVLHGAVEVLSDARFMLMILVYSCFWILYFQNFGSVLWYLRDFIDPSPINTAVTKFLASVGIQVKFKFDAEHVTVVAAGTIVLLQLFVSRIVENSKPLVTMVIGMTIGTCGFLCLALSQHVWIFVLGIAVFSIGEMTCHPKYISYVGLVAPQEKKAIYMGYSFLYGVVGSLIGSNLGGEMYKAFLSPLVEKARSGEDVSSTLQAFWLVFAGLGLVAILGLLAYNHFFGEDTEVSRRRATSTLRIVYLLLIICSIAMVLFVFNANDSLPIKTRIQAGIMAVLGGGGLIMLRSNRTRTETGSP